MPTTPYEEKKYIPSDAVNQAQQALTQQQANKPGQYQSQFQGGMQDLMNQIQNRDKFQYDVNADALYQQVAQNYLQQGKTAMMDTMGQAAALTGGYGNSYAQTAGQQQYNQHLLGLAEMVPQFQQMALQQYQMEGDDLMDRYALMMQQDESAYARYQDYLNRYYADLDRAQAAYDNERDYDYSRFSDERDFDYGKYMDDLNYQYQVGRDQVADDQWNQQWLHQQERDRIQDEQWQKEYDEMVRQWQKEYDEKVRQFNENLAWQKEQAARSSSGGGGGRSSSSSKKTDYGSGYQDALTLVENSWKASGQESIIQHAYDTGQITKDGAEQLAKLIGNTKYTKK